MRRPQGDRPARDGAAPGITALAALGALGVLVAELTPLYEIVIGPLAVVERSVRGGANHGYALAPVGVLALAMTLGVARGSRPAAAALVALGVVTLFVALAIDLPDTRQSGRLPESVVFEDARARATAGFYLELLAGLLLAGTGTGLLALGRREARAGPARRDDGGREGDTREELRALLRHARELADASATRQGEDPAGAGAPARAVRALADLERRADDGELFTRTDLPTLGLARGARAFDWSPRDRPLLDAFEQVDAYWARNLHRPAEERPGGLGDRLRRR
ncbi:MAG TPA: hypothetical protein VGV40_05905 [Solirubrobacteraceae bacterium]|nr:hypothetical protein [Solirubrobacteraceae bacterium]